MRLIDADALLEKKQERDCCFTVTEWDILNAPTVVPVKRGKWLENDDSWWCSECETENCYAYSEELKRFTDLYCPHCGARMDGGDKD